MRLNLGEKVHFEVMSSSDSSLQATVSSTATHNTENTLPMAKLSETSDEGNGNSSAQRDSLVIQSSSSSSDLEGQDSSVHSSLQMLSGNSEVNDQSIVQQQNMSSFDSSAYYEEGVDPLKKDNAKSAFAITSVRPASDDHDRSVVRNPVSTDSLRETLMGAKTDDSITSSDKQPSLSSTNLDNSEEAVAQAHFQVGSPKEEEDQPTGVVEELATPSATSINQTQGASTLQEDPTIPAQMSNASSSVGGAVGGASSGATAGNGTSVQPNRFRRVNQYERGRWTVRDSFVTEEQAETTLAAMGENIGIETTTQSTKYHVNIVKESDIAAAETEGLANGTSPLISQQHHQDHISVPTTTTDSAMITTELRNLPGNSVGGSLIPVVGGGGGGVGGSGNTGLNDATSDRDSSSVHMDRSSTAAETLSRNTSMSSIVPEKSIDGEDLLHDSEVESVSGGVGGGGGGSGGGGGTGGGLTINSHPTNQDQDLEELPIVSSSSTQPPVVLTSSVAAVPSPSVTTVVRHHDPAPLVASSHSDIRKESEGEVDLQRVKNAMSLLQDELQLVLTSTSNASLMEENKSLKERVTRLEEENFKLKKLEDENMSLKKELKRLKDSLTFLVAGPAESSEQTTLGTLPPSNESSNNSQSQGFT